MFGNFYKNNASASMCWDFFMGVDNEWENILLLWIRIFFYFYVLDDKTENATTNGTSDGKNKIKVDCAPKVIPENEVL